MSDIHIFSDVVQCPKCKGTGEVACPICNGSGREYTGDHWLMGAPCPKSIDCERCGGAGQIKLK